MQPSDSVDVASVLGSLKDFQRRSVDYVFDRFYGKDPTRRFLLADEVGLGKTHVARGVIAKTIEHLRALGERRIDVVYICSNADIARQNIRRLNVTGQDDFQLASRITMLPQNVRELEKNTLNFISFTPGTSFNLGSSEGRAEERLLIYWLLKRTWPRLFSGAGPSNVLQGRKSKQRFRAWLREFDPHERIDAKLATRFAEQLRAEDKGRRAAGTSTYNEQFQELCKRFGRSRKHIPAEDSHLRKQFVGEMRSFLAATCIEALEPDLIILDEFQRFKDLLRPDNDAGAMARRLFEWGDARALLLSATPYKMYTLSHESDVDDHYRDFLDTVRFLVNDEDRTANIRLLVTKYGHACARVHRDGVEPVRSTKRQLEAELRRIMCRTEKLAVTENRSGMLKDVDGLGVSLRPQHVRAYLGSRRVADALGHPDLVDYWKASPFLFNFMDADHYKLKSLLVDATRGRRPALDEALAASSEILLERQAWRGYLEVDPRHAQLDRLLADTVGRDWWRRLWIAPAHPVYKPEGAFADGDAATMTKRLVFSSWHIVPRAISILLSYEAERRMMTAFDSDAENTTEARERRSALLMFTRSDGRLSGMPVLAMLYPSTSLVELGSAAMASASIGAGRPTLQTTLQAAAEGIANSLSRVLGEAPDDGPEDESWYWAAPILLDRARNARATESWFEEPAELAMLWSGEEEESKGWQDHVTFAAEVADGRRRPTGRPPADLHQVLALLAIAGPANCVLRAFGHELGADQIGEPTVRFAAGRASWGLRSLFNGLDVIAMIRGANRSEPYWLRVLQYCADGCLQSTLDEYIHLLVESEGLADAPADQAASELARVIASTSGMRAATPGFDWVAPNDTGQFRIENQRVRSRFAMRFGDERGERDESSLRKEVVRKAFNSPFWPFVLATTSIGQEGLDFHSYCHAVVHWNLPSNPVDMEQREGRVHRYKGHAVRKNVAQAAHDRGVSIAPGNPWPELFRLAQSTFSHDSDICPYWVFPIEGGAVIERHVPSLPLSREAARLPAIRRSLAVYRMVFGQARQEDLVAHLNSVVPQEQWSDLTREVSIDLEPRQPVGMSPSDSERTRP